MHPVVRLVATTMYLRVSTVRKSGKTYRYAQIVESYRWEDGKPIHRVLVSLGQRTDREIAAIRAALAVGRKRGSNLGPEPGAGPALAQRRPDTAGQL